MLGKLQINKSSNAEVFVSHWTEHLLHGSNLSLLSRRVVSWYNFVFVFLIFNTIEYKVAHLCHLRLITWIGRLGGKKVFTSHTSAFLVWFSLGL